MVVLDFPDSDRLSEREKQVVSALLLTGKSNVELGKYLGVTRTTVSDALYRAYTKVGLQRPLELFTFYVYLIPKSKNPIEIKLTETERAIAPWVHLYTAEISARVYLAPTTIEDTLRRLYKKCGVRSRREFLSKRSSFRFNYVG